MLIEVPRTMNEQSENLNKGQKVPNTNRQLKNTGTELKIPIQGLNIRKYETEKQIRTF